MFVIEYEYPGTTNGRPVGKVYARSLRNDIPDYPEDVWSYVKNPADATVFSTRAEAEREVQRRHWPRARVWDATEAPLLEEGS